MPEIRATLPERYALALTMGLVADVMLFTLTTLLILGVAFRGSADLLTWVLLLLFWGFSALFGVFLGILCWHDRELFRKPQEHRNGDLA